MAIQAAQAQASAWPTIREAYAAQVAQQQADKAAADLATAAGPYALKSWRTVPGSPERAAQIARLINGEQPPV